MQFLIECINYILPIGLTILIYIIYYNVFIVGYAKRIRKVLDNNDLEKFERMKRIAIKRQPSKMPKLLYKYGVLEKQNIMSKYEITMDKNQTENSEFDIDIEINKKDLISYEYWLFYNINFVRVKYYVIINFSLILFILLISILSFNTLPVFFIVYIELSVIAILFQWLYYNIKYRKYKNKSIEHCFYNNKITMKRENKMYSFPIEHISKVDITKKFIYISLNYEIYIIIPKRYIINDNYNKVTDYIKKLKPNVVN